MLVGNDCRCAFFYQFPQGINRVGKISRMVAAGRIIYQYPGPVRSPRPFDRQPQSQPLALFQIPAIPAQDHIAQTAPFRCRQSLVQVGDAGEVTTGPGDTHRQHIGDADPPQRDFGNLIAVFAPSTGLAQLRNIL